MSTFDDLLEKASGSARYPSGTNSTYGFAKPPRKHSSQFRHGTTRHRVHMRNTALRRTPGQLHTTKSAQSNKPEQETEKSMLTGRLINLAKGF